MDKEVFIQKLDDTFTVLQQLEVCIKELKDCIDEINTVSDKYNNINTNIWCHNITLQVTATASGVIYLNILSNKETSDINDVLNYLNGIQGCTGYLLDASYYFVTGISKNDTDIRIYYVNEYETNYYDVLVSELNILSDNTRKVAIIND